MNHILILLSAILIIGLSAPAYAQTISNHVVINEVDTNPFGDDSKSFAEWVELYNPTDSDVDLSGWEIASTTVLKKTFTIPDGTIISPGGFLTYTHAMIWFTDSSELVELRNTDGIIIDKTPFITDLKNDFSSWQRSYDGFSDWEFSLSSAGGSNGKFVEFSNSSPIVITVSSDKISYLFDDVAVIGGTVSEKIYVESPVFQTAPIIVTISGPNFDQVVSLYPDSNLNYETSLKLHSVLGINEGVYDVSVNYAGILEETSFTVNSEFISDPIEKNSTFSIQTDESEYLSKQSISLTGFSSNLVPFESLKFTVIDPNDDTVSTGSLFTTDGNFATSILLNTVNPTFGTYTITAEYSNETAKTTFNLIETLTDNTKQLISDSLTFQLDNSEYLLNDSMIISGNISNFDSNNSIYYQVVRFTFSTSDGTPVTFLGHFDENDQFEKIPVPFTTTAIPDEFGEFFVTIRIPPITFTSGNYVVTGNYGGLIDSKLFSTLSEKLSTDEKLSIDEESGAGNPNSSIPGKPTSDDQRDSGGYVVSNVKTIIEKVNRISDNLILINTPEKFLNGQSVKPRVLSGSMITPDKSNQSNVNLQVKSESGICIIGQNSDCLVSESTRKPGQIFELVQVDGLNFNVRYSGTDVRLEKFSISPESSDDFLPDVNWDVEVLKDDEVSRFYYKVTYKTLQ